MHTEVMTCRACVEKCIASSHRPVEWGSSSFFKIMEPNFSSRLEIPTGFVKRMQQWVCKDAILQGPSGHLWHVNLCCADTLAFFTDGWESFVSDQSIEAEDILVFRHVHDVHFAVQVFGPSGCEKQNSFSFQNYTSCCIRERNLNLSTICNKKRCEHRQNSTTAYISCLLDTKPNRNGDVEVKGLKRDQNETASDCSVELINSSEINATDIIMLPMEEQYSCENEPSLCEENHPTLSAYREEPAPVGEEKISLPHLTRRGTKSAKSNSSRKLPEFTVVLHKSAVTGQYRITVPKEFADCWMPKLKVNKLVPVILLYEKKPKKWEVMFRTYKSNSGLFYGWRNFAVSNGLQQGDTCVFKMVDKLRYIFKVHVIRHGLNENRGGRKNKINVTNAHALVPHEKMKTSVVNINPYRLVGHEESIIPHSMVEYKKGSSIGGSTIGYESHNPAEVKYIQGPTGKNKIEVIELD